MGPQPNPTTTIIIIMATTQQQQQQGTGTGMEKLAEKPTLLGEKQQDKLKIHGRTLLEFEVGPATDKTNLDELDWEDVRDLMLLNKNLVQSVDLYGIHKSKIV